MANPTVSDNVRAEVRRARRTEQSVAENIGMPITNWKRRMRFPLLWKLDELKAVARELHVSLDSLTRLPQEER